VVAVCAACAVRAGVRAARGGRYAHAAAVTTWVKPVVQKLIYLTEVTHLTSRLDSPTLLANHLGYTWATLHSVTCLLDSATNLLDLRTTLLAYLTGAPLGPLVIDIARQHEHRAAAEG
jgi:hypothetical protein